MTITIDQMISREVNCCLSSLVSTLASGYGTVLSLNAGASDLQDLIDQASELACPIPDYEEAATQAGWKHESPDALWVIHDGRDDNFTADTAEEACRIDNIESYEREVYEHWAVSPWLAEKLEAQGEKVDTDFAGMCVWARTCTGQGIANDGCVERIYAAMVAA